MRNASRSVRLACIVLFLSLLDGRSAQAPPEPVTRFRDVKAYSLFVQLKSDDDMNVNSGRGESLKRKFKEELVARIDLTERHLDNDYVEWSGEGFAEQILQQEHKEVHANGYFVKEVKSVAKGNSKTKAKLVIDELQKTFQVIVDTEYVAGTESGYRKDDPKPTESISGPASLVTTAVRWLQTYPLPGAGLALNANKPYPMEQCGTYCQDFDWLRIHGDHAHKGRLNVDLVPVGTETPKLILTPPADYSTWRPKPPLTLIPQPQPSSVNVASLDNRKLPLDFLLQFRYPKFLPAAYQSREQEQLHVDPRLVRPTLWPFDVGWEIVPADTRVVKVTFQLTDVSRYPGECMNWPPTPKTGPDLEFIPDPSYGNHILQEPFQTLTLLDLSAPHGQGPRGTVRLGSRDGAAIGVLVATAELKDRPPIHGVIRRNESSYRLLIPDHEEGKSDIAKHWRRERAGKPEDRGDKDDDEEAPQGDGQIGDGLTVWEEYRGFRQGGKWRDDCYPRKKDLFIHNTVGADAQGGINTFREATGLIVHDQLLESERKSSRVINFNARDGHPHTDQHCLVLRVSDNPEKGTAKGEWHTALPGSSLGPPKNTRWVNVMINRRPDTSQFPDLVVTRSWQSKHIAHELSHGIGVDHHGDGDGRVRWRRGRRHPQLFEEGQILEGGTPIKVAHERGSGLRDMTINEVFGSADAVERMVYLGRRSGQHSGNVDCVMRYVIAEAYQNISDLAHGRILHDTKEPTGFELCNSPVGTVINDLMRNPQSRYGPADTNRGNCSRQFVISDKWDRPLPLNEQP